MSLTKVSFSMVSNAPLNVIDLGADPTGATDCTAIIQAALDEAKNVRPVYFPAGTYKITDTLVIATNGASNLKIYGDGWDSKIVQATDNTPILKIAGMGVSIRDMGFAWTNIQAAANTNAIAIAPDFMYQCFFENIYCYGAYAFVYVRPISTTYNGASNLYFSCSFKDIYIQTYSGYGFYGVGYGGGVTGNSYDNIYINGQTPNRSGSAGTATAAIALGSQDESVFNQINIEATNLTHAISIDGISSGIVFNSTHIEGCTFTSDVLWMRNVYGVSFNGVVFRGNTIGANNKGFAYVEGNARVSFNGIYEYGTTVGSYTFYRYRSTLTYSGSYINNVNVYANTTGVMATDSLYSTTILATLEPVLTYTTTNRNLLPVTAANIGSMVFDTTLGKPVWLKAYTPHAAGTFIIGVVYTIATVGTTDFTLIGAASNTVGVIFTATGAGSGTGDAYSRDWVDATGSAV